MNYYGNDEERVRLIAGLRDLADFLDQNPEVPAPWGADVFVFPSRTDTFGVVQLEALACGVPVAAYPVSGPKDVIGDHPIGALDADLRAACLKALTISRVACRAFALTRSWDRSALQFLSHCVAATVPRAADVPAGVFDRAGVPHPEPPSA